MNPVLCLSSIDIHSTHPPSITMAPLRSISELASIIESCSRKIENGLKGTSGAEFSLALGTPPLIKLDPALEAARNEIIETTDELRARILGPVGYFMTTSWKTVSFHSLFCTTNGYKLLQIKYLTLTQAHSPSFSPRYIRIQHYIPRPSICRW